MRTDSRSLFFSPNEEYRDFSSVVHDVQEYISSKYSSLITDGGDDEIKQQVKRYIGQYLMDYRIAVKDMNSGQLTDAVYSEMAEFSFLTKYIFGAGVEEVNINSWRDIEVQYSSGDYVKLDERFDSPEHALNVVRRMLHVSGMVLDNTSPAVLGHIRKNIRVSVMAKPLVDSDAGVSGCIRIVKAQLLTKEDFLCGGRATAEMLDFLACCLRYGISVCIAGATNTGKTTLTGWLLSTIQNTTRIFTIEDGSRELAVVKEKDGKVLNSVVQTLTRHSDNEKMNIDQEMLLDMALRFNPGLICIGEMRSAEAYAAQEAARTGHTVLTTIHSNSCEATYRRMCSLCKRKYDIGDETLMSFVTEAFPIIVYMKQLENKQRRIMEIAECEIPESDGFLGTGPRVSRSLYRYDVRTNQIENNKYVVNGEHRKVSPASDSLQRRFLENGMPRQVLNELMKGGLATA